MLGKYDLLSKQGQSRSPESQITATAPGVGKVCTGHPTPHLGTVYTVVLEIIASLLLTCP